MRMKNRRAFEKKDKDLLDYAHSYLSKAFPNPDRQGCPPDAALRSLALSPTESEPTVTEHLAACSPCFRRYAELLVQLRSQRAAEGKLSWARVATWSRSHPVLVGGFILCALSIAIGASLLLNRIRVPNPPLDTHRAPNPVQPVNPTVAYAPFSLDLSTLSPVRGSEPSATGSHQRIHVPSSPLYLTLTLPLASEERSYNVRLTASGHTLWSKSAQAHPQEGKTLIRVEADFRQVAVGNYNLEIESSTGFRLVQPVSIETALPSSTERKR